MNKAQVVKTLLFVLFVIGGFELIWFNPKTETAADRDLFSVHQARQSIQNNDTLTLEHSEPLKEPPYAERLKFCQYGKDEKMKVHNLYSNRSCIYNIRENRRFLRNVNIDFILFRTLWFGLHVNFSKKEG